MSEVQKLHTIQEAKAVSPTSLRLTWSDGTKAIVDIAPLLDSSPELGDTKLFAQVAIGDWGHSLEWPSGVELGADALWLETLTATERDDTRRFIEWRLRNGLSLSKAADALGLSRRMVAYYSSGEKPVPRTVLLACQGWELGPPAAVHAA